MTAVPVVVVVIVVAVVVAPILHVPLLLVRVSLYQIVERKSRRDHVRHVVAGVVGVVVRPAIIRNYN